MFRLRRPLRQSLACADTVTVDFGSARPNWAEYEGLNRSEVGEHTRPNLVPDDGTMTSSGTTVVSPDCRVEGAGPSPSFLRPRTLARGLSANAPVLRRAFLRTDGRDARFAPSRADFNPGGLGAQAPTRAPGCPSTPCGRRRTSRERWRTGWSGRRRTRSASSTGAPRPGPRRRFLRPPPFFVSPLTKPFWRKQLP